MTSQKSQAKKDWLDDGIRHLKALCQEASESADKSDVLPSSKGLVAAVQLLQTFRHANAPKMGLTANGEIILTWENTGDKFKAYVRPDGSVQFLRNKTPIDERSFKRRLTVVPA